MQDTVQSAKRTLRRQVRVELERLGEAERAAASGQARARLAALPLWQRARSVLFFAPLPKELDIWPLLTAALSGGKRVALPRFAAGIKAYEACWIEDLVLDLQTGEFGIREPNGRCARLASNRLDLALVPGVAFDTHGRRLGRGKGYYDRLLKALQGTTCGVGFDQQVVPSIPVEAHDVRLDCVLTPTRWIELRT